MLLSFAFIIICGFVIGEIMQKLGLPALLGMVITGVILGPYVLNFISPHILGASADLREIALIVILIRAGLALDVNDLKRVGRPAILMCFVPATFELMAITVFAPIFLKISYLEAAIMGAVLAAVSPAVVVPRMLKLMDEGYGIEKGVPQLIMAGASVDDIYVIVLFTSFIDMHQGQGFALDSLLKVPVSITVGLLIGITAGLLILWVFKRIHIRDTIKVLIIFSVAFVFVALEGAVKAYVPISGLLAVMALGAIIKKNHEHLAKRLSVKFSKIWVGAELLLFVLVGAAVDIHYLKDAGIGAVMVILTALILRTAGVFTCLIKTKLSKKERLFCAISYLPKATVQAAIGGIPLSIGISAGNTILAVAVLSIMITGPLGALCIDGFYKSLLQKDAAKD